MKKQHHILLVTHALALMPDCLVRSVASHDIQALSHGAYAPDTVAYWADHIANYNPYDPTDNTHGHAVDVLVGGLDMVATLVLPFDRNLSDSAFLLGCISHVAADLCQPYHVGGRHQQDHVEHAEFEARMQEWALARADIPELGMVTLPHQMRDYLGYVVLPKSYGSYRDLLGNKQSWAATFAEIHARAVHNILVTWQVLEREVARRKDVTAKLNGETDLEPADAGLAKGN